VFIPIWYGLVITSAAPPLKSTKLYGPDSKSIGSASGTGVPTWVTVIVFALKPVPVTVTVAILSFDVVLASAVRVTKALPSPFVELTFSQVWLLAAIQFTFDVIVKAFVLPIVYPILKLFAESIR